MVAPEDEGLSGSLVSRFSGGVCSSGGVGDEPVTTDACGVDKGSATGVGESGKVVEVDKVMRALAD